MKFQKIIVLLFICLINSMNNQIFGQENNNTEISLLTCSPGQELYSLFGHSAIRLKNKAQNLDIVFNYGTFDFDTPGFALKFIRGKLPYKLAVAKYKDFLREYQYYQRDVVEQKLNIDSTEKVAIVYFLKENAKPENAYYAYDFLFDNCSTRIRDVIYENIDKNKVKNEIKDSITFREMLIPYIKSSEWTSLGIHLILSGATDKIADNNAQMFLPDYLHDNLAKAKVDNEFILDKSEVLLSYIKTENKTSFWLSPKFLFLLLFLVLIVLHLSNYKKAFKIIKKMLYLIGGLGGLLFLFMWLFTDHQATYANWNLLWLNPLYLILLKEQFSLRKQVVTLLILLNVASIANIFIGYLPQYFDYAFVDILFLQLFCLIIDKLRTNNQMASESL